MRFERFIGVCLLTAALTACQAMAPQGVGPSGSQFSAQKEASSEPSPDEPSESPSAAAPPSTPGDPGPAVSGAMDGVSFRAPLAPHQDLMAMGDKPQAGGVTALPAEVEGGEGARTAFEFTLEGEGEPMCVEPEPEISSHLFPRLNYFVRGEVGAVLLDGTEVPLTGCEVVMLRFQTGSGNAVRCQDIPAKADCSLFGRIRLRNGEKPKVYFLTLASMFDDCEDMGGAHFPAKNDMTFLPPSGKLSDCKDPVLNERVLSHPSFRSKFVKP